jgi:hypothetical protein
VSKTTVNFHQESLPQILGPQRRIHRARLCLPELHHSRSPRRWAARRTGLPPDQVDLMNHLDFRSPTVNHTQSAESETTRGTAYGSGGTCSPSRRSRCRASHRTRDRLERQLQITDHPTRGAREPCEKLQQPKPPREEFHELVVLERKRDGTLGSLDIFMLERESRAERWHSSAESAPDDWLYT